MNSIVTLGSDYQIEIPEVARKTLSLSAGDELLVLCKSDRIVIIPKPEGFAKHTAGLHREVWQDADAYLRKERQDW